MEERPLRTDGNLTVALSAWMFLLHGRGLRPASEELRAALDGVDGEAAGKALVGVVASALGDASTPEQVRAFVIAQYGDAIVKDFGEGNRESRTRRIRRFQFECNMPWLARIYERHHSVVQPTWILVERVTDEVLALDPDPWDGLDEERSIPVSDFMVLWELDGCSSVAARAC